MLAVGTRLQDFTTGSHALFPQATLVSINVNGLDALKWRACRCAPTRAADSRAVEGGRRLARRTPHWVEGAIASEALAGRRAAPDRRAGREAALRRRRDRRRPAVGRRTRPQTTSSCALPARCPASCTSSGATSAPGGYHVEYGYSCMGYEIAGGLGVKMARPDREVVVMVGDGSYLMLNAEIATSIMLGHKLVIVVLDNRGYGCINRLQQAVGGAPFNNLFDDCVQGGDGAPAIDFAMNAKSLGALAEHVKTIRRARSGA